MRLNDQMKADAKVLNTSEDDVQEMLDILNENAGDLDLKKLRAVQTQHGDKLTDEQLIVIEAALSDDDDDERRAFADTLFSTAATAT